VAWSYLCQIRSDIAKNDPVILIVFEANGVLRMPIQGDPGPSDVGAVVSSRNWPL
jgi:hypothetical protein